MQHGVKRSLLCDQTIYKFENSPSQVHHMQALGNLYNRKSDGTLIIYVLHEIWVSTINMITRKLKITLLSSYSVLLAEHV